MYNRFFKLVVKIPHCSPPQLMSKALQQALGPLASSLHLDTLSCCIMYPNPINRAILKCVVGRVGTLNRKSKGSKVSMAVCTDYHCARPVSLRSLAISSGIAHRCIAPLPSASIDCIGLLPRASVLDKTQALACCQQISQRPCHLYAALSDRTGSLAGNLTANCAPPAMSEQALRLADDLRRLHISDSDIAAILSPDKSNLHRMCARQVTLRELDYAADVAGLILSESDESNLVIADLSTFMHNCMTVYTHLEDPLYLFCGTPFSRVHLFESPKELAEYAASHQYQELELPVIGWADEISSLSDGSFAALKYRELVVDLAHAMRDNAEDLELALQDPEVVEQTSVLLDAVLVCRCIISPEKLGEFEELCGAYNLL